MAHVVKPLDDTAFERIVRDAIEALPEEFLARLENVDVVVEDRPSPEQRERNDVADDETLLGLYEGVPLTERHGYNMVVPDRITIFKRPLEEECANETELAMAVQQTVVHEVAHYFGISDEKLDAMGLG